VRAQTQKNAVKAVTRYSVKEIEEFAKKINLKKNLINKILPYSAIKIIANPNLPYSILNPETSSDSPSAKSKGVRLVSARQEINQTPTKGKNKRLFDQLSLAVTDSVNLKVPVKIK